MLRVIQSNRLEELAGAIAEALPAGDPFARPTLVVSSRLVARWMQYELARRRGITGALDLPFLEPFLERTFRADGLRGLDRARLAALVASALADPALVAEPALAPVRAYLGADGGEDAVRRVQLAGRVAAHLWDYALNRPDWLDAWDDRRDADVGDVDPVALAWQRRIYDAVLGPDGLAARAADGTRWVPVPRLPHARRRLGLPAPVLDAPVHVVGFSYLARAHLDALSALAGADVHVAMVTPCAEYWDDVPGRRGGRAVEAAAEPLALVYWGGPGRDTASMLLSATEGDVTERTAEPEDHPLAGRLAQSPTTALAAWSRDILHRAEPTTKHANAGVTVLACPSISRELEIVGSEIWRLLRADASLRATDITILVAGDPDARARYLAQVGPVFGSLHRLPFHLIEAPAAGSGRVAEAALELLELGLGRFTRREMLALMTHPAVLARHPHVEPADWVRWCQRLGIAHGAEAADHQGTYLAGPGLSEAFHWAQGIRRLALGGFVAGERAGLDEPVAIGGCDLLPEELTPDQEPSAATFALLARSLIADARWLAGRAEPLRRWAEILPALVEAYLGDLVSHAGADISAAAGARARVADVLRGLADLDLDGRLVPYREVVELARQRLGAMREGRGEPLVHGVMIAPLEPMRPLPSAVTFVVGLGEGLFPAGDQPSPLDLRAQRRSRGDVAPRDRDRYGFLEALLAARRQVYLSYVARDEQSGDTRAPSSVIHELSEMLAPYLGAATAAEALARLTVVHPLRRWDDPETSASPAAARERHAIEVRRSLDEHLRISRRAAPDAGRLRELLAAPELAELRGRLRLDLADGVPAPGDDDDSPVVISLATLRKFLETPVQAWAQVVLRLDALDTDEDDADREDEPFDVSPRDRAAVLREVFATALGAGGKPAEPLEWAYERVRKRRALAGQAPLGLFGDAARHRDLERLQFWERELEARGARSGPWHRIGFGRATTAVATLDKPITLDLELRGRLRRVEIVGTTELFGGADRERSVVLINREATDEHRLRNAVDHLVLAAAGLAEGDRCGLVLGEKVDQRRLAAWTAEAARAHLVTLVGDLLGGPHAYYLPLGAAKNALKGEVRKPTPNPNDRTPPLGWGPLDRDPGLAIPADAAAIARRRLAPLAEREEKEK